MIWTARGGPAAAAMETATAQLDVRSRELSSWALNVELPANALQPDDPSAAFVAALRRRGATSPKAACPATELPRITSSRLRALLDSGLVRECADGALYVYELPVRGVGHDYPTGRRLVLTLAFWLTAIIVPVVLFQWSQ
jgi:hypothetical protein